jgi:hypothetical protein
MCIMPLDTMQVDKGGITSLRRLELHLMMGQPTREE